MSGSKSPVSLADFSSSKAASHSSSTILPNEDITYSKIDNETKLNCFTTFSICATVISFCCKGLSYYDNQNDNVKQNTERLKFQDFNICLNILHVDPDADAGVNKKQ